MNIYSLNLEDDSYKVVGKLPDEGIVNGSILGKIGDKIYYQTKSSETGVYYSKSNQDLPTKLTNDAIEAESNVHGYLCGKNIVIGTGSDKLYFFDENDNFKEIDNYEKRLAQKYFLAEQGKLILHDRYRDYMDIIDCSDPETRYSYVLGHTSSVYFENEFVYVNDHVPSGNADVPDRNVITKYNTSNGITEQLFNGEIPIGLNLDVKVLNGVFFGLRQRNSYLGIENEIYIFKDNKVELIYSNERNYIATFVKSNDSAYFYNYYTVANDDSTLDLYIDFYNVNSEKLYNSKILSGVSSGFLVEDFTLEQYSHLLVQDTLFLQFYTWVHGDEVLAINFSCLAELIEGAEYCKNGFKNSLPKFGASLTQYSYKQDETVYIYSPIYDEDIETHKFELEGAPDWLNISKTGDIYGIVPNGVDYNEYSITVSVVDELGGEVSQNFTLIIGDKPTTSSPSTPSTSASAGSSSGGGGTINHFLIALLLMIALPRARRRYYRE